MTDQELEQLRQHAIRVLDACKSPLEYVELSRLCSQLQQSATVRMANHQLQEREKYGNRRT